MPMKKMPFAQMMFALTLLIPSVRCAADAADLLTQAIQSGAAAEWNQPQAPLKIFGNTYYVGVAGLSSVLIQDPAGLILIDGDLPQSVPLIEANIRTLGFKLSDIKLILNSHAHFDHAGGIAALQRDSRALVLASPSSARALRAGHLVDDDPQLGFSHLAAFPAVAQVRELHDGETVRLGKLAVTAHFTPGHTPGSTTWTWRSCEKGTCLNIVYADSLNALSAPGFHFLADKTHADLTASFRKSIQTVAELPCDILISVHPEVAGVDKKLQQLRSAPSPNPFVDAQSCRVYAADYAKALETRIAEEKSAASP